MSVWSISNRCVSSAISPSNVSRHNSRIEDPSADCLIALEMTFCSWEDVSVHWAASTVSPRHLAGGVWNLGRGFDAASYNLCQVGVFSRLLLPATADSDANRSLKPGTKDPRGRAGPLGRRGPIGSGGRLPRVRPPGYNEKGIWKGNSRSRSWAGLGCVNTAGWSTSLGGTFVLPWSSGTTVRHEGGSTKDAETDGTDKEHEVGAWLCESGEAVDVRRDIGGKGGDGVDARVGRNDVTKFGGDAIVLARDGD